MYCCQHCLTLKYPLHSKQHKLTLGSSGNDWGKCKRPDRSYSRLGAVEEQGQEQAHTLKICGTYVWCVKCYSYAETKPVNLRLACKGLKTTAGRHAIQQLEKGYTPAMAKEHRNKLTELRRESH